MIKNIGWHMLLGLVLGGAQGCTTLSESGYSARYVPVLQADNSLQYLPQACLAPDGGGIENRLPPGCANALNLAQMVVSKDDLHRGHEMGPALVGPAADAVERYLGVKRDLEVESARQKRLIGESRTAK